MKGYAIYMLGNSAVICAFGADKHSTMNYIQFVIPYYADTYLQVLYRKESSVADNGQWHQWQVQITHMKPM